jgi:histidine triad (HIT) family protein
MTLAPGARGAPGACAFCAIARGESPASIVLERERFVAFLDRTPLFHGHVLLIPRAHVVTLPDLPEEDVGPLFSLAKLLAGAMPGALHAEGSFVAVNNVVSQSVAHLHVHVVPRTKGDGLKGFFWPRNKYPSDADRELVATALRTWIDAHPTSG